MRPILPIRLLLVLCLAAAFPLSAQESAPESSSDGPSLMSNPRLRNVLRSVKQESEEILDQAKQDPEEAVREAARQFQLRTDGVEVDKIKAAAAAANKDGSLDRTVEKATEAVNQAMETEGGAKAKEALNKAVDSEEGSTVREALSEAARQLPATAPKEAAQAMEVLKAEPVPPTDVPATRPAPGISGGVPTPVAMPVEPGAPAIPDSAAPSSGPGALSSESVVQPIMARPIAGSAPTVPELPDLGPGEAPAPKPLAPRYPKRDRSNPAVPGSPHMEVLSKEAIMDNTKGLLVFTGDVFVDSPDYEMKCDRLEIHLADGVGQDGSESESSFKRAIASGGMVEIKRFAIDEDGKKKTQIALGRRADYNALTQEFVLSGGPPYIQDGDRFVRTTSEDAKIIMRGNGLYEITGTTNRSHIVIPVDNKENDGKKKKGGINATGGLENAFDRLR